MICQQCKEQGLKSRVTVGSSSVTLLYCYPFYDEEGNYHYHDSNTTITVYECSHGHTWREESSPVSCWCGWPNLEYEGLQLKEL